MGFIPVQNSGSPSCGHATLQKAMTVSESVSHSVHPSICLSVKLELKMQKNMYVTLQLFLYVFLGVSVCGRGGWGEAGVRLGFECPCPPVRNNIVTLCHLFKDFSKETSHVLLAFDVNEQS